jgi:hypothetical protein
LQEARWRLTLVEHVGPLSGRSEEMLCIDLSARPLRPETGQIRVKAKLCNVTPNLKKTWFPREKRHFIEAVFLNLRLAPSSL